MKVLVFSLGLGCLQFLMDQTCAFVDQSFKKEVDQKMVIVDERWGCSKRSYPKFHYQLWELIMWIVLIFLGNSYGL